MKKYLVDIYLPASGCHYDVYLPACKRIDEATRLLVSLMEPLSGGSYRGTSNTMLLDAVSGEPYDRGATVLDAGIRNASRLILI